MPEASAQLAEQVTALAQELRTRRALQGARRLRNASTGWPRWSRSIAIRSIPTAVDETLGVVLKAKDDLEALRGAKVSELFERAMARRLTPR